MNLSSGSDSNLYRFIAGRLHITSTAMPAVLLVITGLASLVVLSISACGSSVSETPQRTRPVTERTSTPTPPTNAPTPTATPIPTAIPIPTPMPHPTVVLQEPKEDEYVDCGPEVMLRWSAPHALETDECYQVRLWAAGRIRSLFSHTTTEDHFSFSSSDLSPGAYNWAVAIVRSVAGTYELVSKESTSYHFHVPPPTPVVRSISPASTRKGTPAPVVISGENFTHSVALTIGVPLLVTFVNSSTIQATVPATLEVGEYEVIVHDWRGKGAPSDVFFKVKQDVTPTPYYPPPQLMGIDVMGRACIVVFKWSWPGVLAEDEWFAIRVGKVPDIPHSQNWTKDCQYSFSMYTLDGEKGEYDWEVALCRGEPSEARCQHLSVSKREFFSLPGDCPPRPKSP